MILCSNQTVRLCWSSAGSTHETRQRLTVFLFISVKQNYSQTISWGLLLLIFRLLLLQHVMNLCKNSLEVKTACFSLVFHRELNEIAFIKGDRVVWTEAGVGLQCWWRLWLLAHVIHSTSDDSSFHQSSLKPPLYPVSDQIRLTAWWNGASEYFVNLMRKSRYDSAMI